MEGLEMKTGWVILLLAFAGFAIQPPRLQAQSAAGSGDFATTPGAPKSTQYPDLTYKPPTEKTKFHNYLFDAFGPYPIVAAAVAAGINQADRTPPEWGQGAEGYGKRYASNFGIAIVSTTTRYGLSEALHEDTLYYRCECKGFFPRLGHATISTFTARRGEDGHRVFSFPSLIAPYAGTMTAVYGWFPGRYGVQDGFRMGNYALLGYVGQNLALEFLYAGPHSWLSRLHLNNRHGAPDPASKP
jgi:hypothetical protein